MIDLNIIEIFSTVGVGLATCILLAYFYFYFCKLFFVKMYNTNAFLNWLKHNLNKDFSKTGHSIALSVLVYSLGVIMLDMTDYMTDSDGGSNPVVALVQKASLLEKEKNIRKNTLIRDETELTGLGKEILSNPEFPAHKALFFAGVNHAVSAEEQWKKYGTTISSNPVLLSNLSGSINQLYYDAKNWAYLNSDPVRKELSLIQHHIDFTRSIAIISALSIALLILIFAVYIVRESLKGKKAFCVIVNGKERRMFFYPRLSLLVLIPILLAARECYYAAEKNFDERAFGYYSSYLKLEANKNAGTAQPIPAQAVVTAGTP